MGRKASFIAAVACIASAVIPADAAPSRVVLGWNAFGTTASYITLNDRAPGLNTVSPLWWTLRSDGTIADRGDAALVRWARAHGVSVWPMFTNDLDQASSRRAMADQKLKPQVIERVRALALHYGVQGVNIDWENLATPDRDLFSAFVKDAALSWRSAGLVVSVDVTPRTDSWQLENWSESMDRTALGAAADLVVLMAYDQHNRLRPNGPTASLPWVEESLRFLLRTVPAEKVVLGVPFYTRDWSDDNNSEVVTISATPSHLRAHNAKLEWQPTLGLTLATYTANGHVHRVWVEDTRSLSLKAALVRRYRLAGVAAWRIGFEGPEAWRALTTRAPAPPASPAEVRPSPVATAVRTPAAVPTQTEVRAARSASRPVSSERPGVGLAVAAAVCFMGALVLSAIYGRRRSGA